MDQTVPLNAVNPSASTLNLQVVQRRATDLVPYVKNARTHSEAQVEILTKSLKQFGFVNPILIDGQNGVIAGHGRLKAAQKLGMAEVPCIVLDHMTEAQRRAYILADNQTALLAGWDDDLLALELGDLNEMGFDLSLIGFDTKELDALLGDNAPVPGLTDPDELPETPATPVTRAGDMWILGKHKLLCGDSTNALSVNRLMGDVQCDLVFTSPPYSQQRTYGSEAGIGNWDDLMRGVFSALPTKPEAQVLVNLGLVHDKGEWQPYWADWLSWMRTSGWRSFGWYVWDQGSGLPGDWNGRLAPSHEFVFHFNQVAESARKTKDKKPENVRVDNTHTMRGKDGTLKAFTNPDACGQTKKIPDSVLRINRQAGGIGKGLDHPAVFPVKLPQEIIEAFSDSGECVYEPFSGSGTSIIAAETTERVCCAIEINPAYVDVAIRRWENYTGRKAVLESGQRTFEAVRAERIDGYNARDDLSKSVDVAYEAVRDRVEAGGPGYVPPTAEPAPRRRRRPPKAVAAE